VRGEQVVSVTSPGGGPSNELTVETALTVEGLFDAVARGFQSNDVGVEVEYHPQWHFPSEADFDYWERGDSDGFKAENLTPLED
jgi:hypothetical protein